MVTFGEIPGVPGLILLHLVKVLLLPGAESHTFVGWVLVGLRCENETRFVSVACVNVVRVEADV